MGNKQYTGVSLFTGAGGMDVGFERAGIKVIFANELMKEAAETYVANHPGCNMVNDDIYNQLPQMGQYIGADFVFGGPPCQGFSVAGKMNPDDERSKLIFTFLDVVEKVQPKLLQSKGYGLNLHTTNKNYLSSTKSVVKAYQKANGLTVDGKAGKNTVSSLGGIFKE